MKVSALILAAGSGKRIGTPKLMLEIEGKSFLSIIAENILSAGVKDIVCVVSEQTYSWAKEKVASINFAINPKPEDGMLSSVYYGMKQIMNCDNVLIIPVDHPYVEVNTYKTLLDESGKNIGAIIKPYFEYRSGHPIIVPFELLKTIDEKCFLMGLDDIIRKSECRKIFVDVNDNGILKNINTKMDYSKK